jgi:heme/copper-type cytochrome/quinol oxidase subunit 3
VNATRVIGRSDLATLREDQLRLGLWMFLATVTMLFAAFASAYVVRRSASDWHPAALPAILWINTLVLGASTAAVELAAHQARRRRWTAAGTAMGSALALGIAFLAGQVAAWRQMAAAGVYLPTNPHSSFFFVLTGAHAVHVIAALVVIAFGTAAIRRRRRHSARCAAWPWRRLKAARWPRPSGAGSCCCSRRRFQPSPRLPCWRSGDSGGGSDGIRNLGI